MRWRNAADRFGWVSIGLHWVTAVLVLGLLSVGYYMVGLDYYDPNYHRLPNLHKSTGMVLASVLLVRVGWHLWGGLPRSLPSLAAWERQLSWVTHKLLYVFLIGSILSGYLMSTAKGADVDVFGLFSVPALPALLDQQEDVAGWWHEIFVYGTAGLVALHVAGALKHHFIDRDSTLKRMLRP